MFPRSTDPKRAQLADAQQWARQLTAPHRWSLLALAGNVLLLLALGGLPYLRGRSRASAAFQRYDALTQCLYGGALRGDRARSFELADQAQARRAFAASSTAGLEEEAALFAARAQLGKPSSCRDALRAVAPSDDLLLWPSLKRVERDLREAVRVADRELSDMPLAVHGAALSQRPLRALAQLRAVLQHYARVADLPRMPAAPEGVARGGQVTPSRLALWAGFDARISLWGRRGTLQVAALDGTGVSYVRVGERVEVTTRVARPRLLRELWVDTEERMFTFWGMPDERCLARDCSGKSSGLSEVSTPLHELPAPSWLAIHLTGPAHSRVLPVGAKTWVVADGALRSFPRVFPGDAPSEQPAAALDELPLGEGQHVLLGPTPRVLTLSPSGVLSLRTLEAERYDTLSTSRQLDVLPGATWLSTCQDGERLGFAIGSSTSLRLGGSAQIALSPSEPARVLCFEHGAVATVLDTQHVLHAVSCASGRCTVSELARAVQHYDVARDGDALVVAHVGDREHPQIFVRLSDRHGVPTGPASLPAACWSPASGMCGSPVLKKLDDRLVLAGREGTDLALLESRDQGRSFQAVPGLPRSLPREVVAELMRHAPE